MTAIPKPLSKTASIALRKRAEKRCDRLWADLVKIGGRCRITEFGGKPHVCKNGLQAMHGIGREHMNTRWGAILPGNFGLRFLNGFPGCAGIHCYYSKGRVQEWDAFLIGLWGKDTFLEMMALGKSPYIATMDDILRLETQLKAEIEAARVKKPMLDRSGQSVVNGSKMRRARE